MTLSPAKEPHTLQLEAGGFTRAGAWHRDDASDLIHFEGDGPLPKEPGVYAYAVGGVVHYVGAAQRGLRRRMRHYEISQTLKTTVRVRKEILVLLEHGTEVEVFTIMPPALSLHGVLPIDTVAGLEEGLIRSWRPAWNRRGVGSKQ